MQSLDHNGVIGASGTGVTSWSHLAMPVLLLAVLAITVWLSVFADAPDRLQPNLRAHGPGEINGVEAAVAAIDLARNAVPSVSGQHDGLFAGPPVQVAVRYEELGLASSWTVFIRGPVRSRPNTPDEFVIAEGEIVIEVSAFTGELSGSFSAGRGVLGSLGISPKGFISAPLDLVRPARLN